MQVRTAQAALSCRYAAIHLVGPDEAEPAANNGDLFARAPTQYGTIPAGRTVRFLLGDSITVIYQQQRIYHRPNPISPAASANHQKDAGRIRDSIINSPMMMAARPHRQRRLLRIKIAPRAVNSIQHMQEALLLFHFRKCSEIT